MSTATTKWLKPEPIGALLADTGAKVKWRLEFYIPEDAVVLLAAYPKMGKSTFTTPLALAMARGDSFLGRATAQCPVLWLSEEPRALVRERFQEFNALASDPLTIHYYAGEPPEALKEVEPYITANGVGLVIVDTALTFLNIVDENDNAKVAAALKTITTIARRTKATILILHHTGKDATGAAMGRDIRGASAFLGYVDQALVLKGGTTETRRVLSSLGRYAEAPELVFELKESGDGHKSLHPVVPKDKQTDLVLAVLTTEPQEIEAIAEAAEVKEGACREALAALVASGTVVREGKGVKGAPFTWRRVAWAGAALDLTTIPA